MSKYRNEQMTETMKITSVIRYFCKQQHKHKSWNQTQNVISTIKKKKKKNCKRKMIDINTRQISIYKFMTLYIFIDRKRDEIKIIKSFWINPNM